jgi:arylsulfatase A-like enzyme
VHCTAYLPAGQYRLGPCKRQPYDYDLRVPALFVGPNIPPGTVEAVAGIADLAPTFLALAGAQAETQAQEEHLMMDGRSLVPLLMRADAAADSRAAVSRSAAAAAAHSPAVPWRTSYLVEYFATTSSTSGNGHLKDARNNTFIGLRVLNESFDLSYFEFTDVVTDYAVEHTNFCELYNLTADPEQLVNLCAAPAGTSRPPRTALRAALRAELYQQWRCRGSSCA